MAEEAQELQLQLPRRSAKEDPLHGIHVQTPYILQAFRGQKFSSHGSGAGKVGICQLELLGLFHLDPAEHPMQLVWQ